MPLLHGSSNAVKSANIREMIRAGHPRDQAIAASLRMARESAKRASGGRAAMADGGQPYIPMRPPYEERSEMRGELERLPAGFIHSPVPGRTDLLPMSPAAGSFVIPADVVSGLAEGNSLAGAAVLDKMLGSEPYGIRPGAHIHGHTIPSPPRPYEYAQGGTVHFAKQGGKVVPLSTTHDAHEGAPGSTPIIAAGGEYIVAPDTVAYHPQLGMGDPNNRDPKHRKAALDRGHKILEAWVKRRRARNVKETAKLPGPAR